MIRITSLRTVKEEARLLHDEPLSQILVPTVGKPANEVGNVVVEAFFGVVPGLLSHIESFAHCIVGALNIQIVLSCEFVDFLGHGVAVRVLV